MRVGCGRSWFSHSRTHQKEATQIEMSVVEAFFTKQTNMSNEDHELREMLVMLGAYSVSGAGE
jgi:hypothetical protein